MRTACSVFAPLCVGTTNTHCVSRRSRGRCRVCEQRTLFWLVPWENCCAATEAVHVCWWRQVKSVSLASRGCPALTVITTAIQMLLWHFDTGRVCASVCILGFCVHMPAYIHGCCVSCACQCDFVTKWPKHLTRGLQWRLLSEASVVFGVICHSKALNLF